MDPIVLFFINREEGNEEAKLENIVGLGLALGNASQISNQTFKHLSDGLQEKEVLRRAYLRALLEVSSTCFHLYLTFLINVLVMNYLISILILSHY